MGEKKCGVWLRRSSSHPINIKLTNNGKDKASVRQGRWRYDPQLTYYTCFNPSIRSVSWDILNDFWFNRSMANCSIQSRPLLSPQTKSTLLSNWHYKQLTQCNHKIHSSKDSPTTRRSWGCFLQNSRYKIPFVLTLIIGNRLVNHANGRETEHLCRSSGIPSCKWWYLTLEWYWNPHGSGIGGNG